jgi:hypothetical protein
MEPESVASSFTGVTKTRGVCARVGTYVSRSFEYVVKHPPTALSICGKSALRSWTVLAAASVGDDSGSCSHRARWMSRSALPPVFLRLTQGNWWVSKIECCREAVRKTPSMRPVVRK